MAFVLFCLLFLLFFFAHFALAGQMWGRMRGLDSNEVDMQYVRQEDYFAQSFRAKLRVWVNTLPRSTNVITGVKSFDKGRERLLITQTVQYPAKQREDSILVVEGSFGCGAQCDFAREMLVKQDCAVGSETRLQALAVDGDLTLGDRVQVTRWLDARGKLTIGPECQIGSRATSRTAIELLPGAKALSLFAPEIATEGRLENGNNWNSPPRRVMQVPHLGQQTEPIFGYDPKRLFAMGGGTYLYDGDLVLSATARITHSLVVRGSFQCPRESLIEGDIKAHGRMQIGPGSVVQGNLTAEGDMQLRPEVYFQGLLQADGVITLSHGCRGLRTSRPLAVFGREGVKVESNVVVRGKLASAKWVEAVSTPVAWLDQERIWTTKETV